MEETPQSVASGLDGTPQTSLDQTGDSGGTPAASEKVKIISDALSLSFQSSFLEVEFASEETSAARPAA